MALVMTAGPAAEPISLAETKAHLRIDGNDEDALLSSLIVAARAFVEKTLARALISESWSLYLDAWPRSGWVALPIAPVQSVTAVRVHDPEDVASAVEAGSYSVDTLSEPARIVLSSGAAQLLPPRRLNAYEVAFTAGYGDDASDVPEPIRHALKLTVAHWFENREPVELGELPQEVQATVAGLLLPYRRVLL
jgi:uncharacterized phiE125 gp8 family phage protein